MLLGRIINLILLLTHHLLGSFARSFLIWVTAYSRHWNFTFFNIFCISLLLLLLLDDFLCSLYSVVVMEFLLELHLKELIEFRWFSLLLQVVTIWDIVHWVISASCSVKVCKTNIGSSPVSQFFLKTCILFRQMVEHAAVHGTLKCFSLWI